MSRKPDAHDALQRDLQAERAAALARAVERLEEALAHAAERLWFLVIQREAVGLLRHESVLEALQVPREVRAAMGPRPRRR